MHLYVFSKFNHALVPQHLRGNRGNPNATKQPTYPHAPHMSNFAPSGSKPAVTPATQTCFKTCLLRPPIPANGGVDPVPMPREAFKRHPNTALVKRYRVKRYQLMFC